MISNIPGGQVQGKVSDVQEKWFMGFLRFGKALKFQKLYYRRDFTATFREKHTNLKALVKLSCYW